MEIKNHYKSLLETSIDSYRGMNYPSYGIIDGDLCDYYNGLDEKIQKEIAEKLKTTPQQIQLKCEAFKHSKVF